MEYVVSCPPYHETRHLILREKIKSAMGEFPYGLLLNSDVRCTREYISRHAFDFTKGLGSMAFISNTGIIEAEGEIVVPHRLKAEVARDINDITLEGMWIGEEAKPCKVVEQHAHGNMMHIHFKCSPYHVYGGIEEDLTEKLANIYRKYAKRIEVV